jgi:transposase
MDKGDWKILVVKTGEQKSMPNMPNLLGEDLSRYEVKGRPDEENRDGTVPEAKRRLIEINRNQMVMRTIDVEGLVEEDHVVRGIWAMVNQLDLRRLEEGIRAVEGRAGRPGFDPRMLMALWIYGYSQGVSSARALSRMCEYEPGCQWITGLQAVNYHALADFRMGQKEALDAIFTEVLGLLSAEGLIELTRVMQDGTKVKAQASSNSFRRKDRIEKHLEMARSQVEAMGSPDAEERSERARGARERARRERQKRLEQALKELEQLQQARPESKRDKVRVSETDPEARVMKQSDGGFASSYNVQISTEASHGIILAVDVTQAGNDFDQLKDGIDRVRANTGQNPDQIVVDGGYIKNANIEAMAERGIDLIGPMKVNDPEVSLSKRGVAQAFYPDQFEYDSANDRMRCPAGKLLRRIQTRQLEGRIEYTYKALTRDCQACAYQRQCCPKTSPRKVVRSEESELVKAFRAKMETEEAKQIYKTRAQIAEFPNAWIKEKLDLRRFRTRGRSRVRTEALWACLTHNIQQWIRIRWKARLQPAL